MSEFMVIAGMSGAGRSTAGDVMEDLGWFVIDNLPPSLIPKVGELTSAGSNGGRFCLVSGSSYVEELAPALVALRATGARVRVLFLEAADDVLVRRYESTRRPHPHSEEGVVDAIAAEREQLAPIKEHADVVVDTSELNIHQLRNRLTSLFGKDDHDAKMRTSIMSFGYKHGVPLDVDLVLDCRFLPNPYWVAELRSGTGLDQPVRDYVLGQPDAKEFLERSRSLLELLLPGYEREGKAYCTIAIGCTGGRHRSVVIAEELTRIVTDLGFSPVVSHRDVGR